MSTMWSLCAALGVTYASGSALRLRELGQNLEGSNSSDTPVTKVVNLLKEMAKTLDTEMQEDEKLYKELGCWCNDGRYEKGEAIQKGTGNVEQLGSKIESLTAKTSQLKTTIKDVEAEFAADKKALAEATAVREKEAADFHSMDLDTSQAVQNLRAAIKVLDKHHGAAPESTVGGGAIFKSEKDSWSFLQSLRGTPSQEERDLDRFMLANGIRTPDAEMKPVASHRFLQQESAGGSSTTWSEVDLAAFNDGMKVVSAFVQSRNGAKYRPAYQSQSGEIHGILKQMLEQMEGDHADATKRETERAASFAELREAKQAEISEGEKLSERKEDELAQATNELAEAKEDIGQEQKILDENKAFLKTLNDKCNKGDADFEERKQARMEEMTAVAETIKILQEDEAREAMTATYNFLQVGSSKLNKNRVTAAKLLREAAHARRDPQLSILATSVQLDAFSKVQAAIDDMITNLKTQQAEEVKKNDFCKNELQSNQMTTAQQQSRQADLETNIAQLETNIKTLDEEIRSCKAEVSNLHLELQRATEDRRGENHEFQQTISDQTVTINVLKKALDRLAKHYDFVQVKVASGQAPPMPQKEYKPSKAASPVMEMIEKLIHEAGELMNKSKDTEQSAQTSYEQLIADTNNGVAALQKEVVAKNKAKAGATKDKLGAESDRKDTIKEIDGLVKYNGDLHQECDYLMKNFDLRQQARSDEVVALQQAQQILKGADMSEA